LIIYTDEKERIKSFFFSAVRFLLVYVQPRGTAVVMGYWSGRVGFVWSFANGSGQQAGLPGKISKG